MPKLSIRLLGECQFIYDGEVIAGLQTKRLRSLLGYLLLHAGQQLSALQLAFLFWPDSTEKQARTNLRRLFFNLRKTFPQSDEFLDRGDQSVQWRADSGYALDVDQFETGLDEAAGLLAAEDFGAARTVLEAAVDTYRGDLLPDSYDDWILAYREQLRQRYLGALEQLMELLEGDGDYRAAVRYGELLLREDPLSEKPYRSLMRLHALSGDRASALRVYHACAFELERELGVEPHAETTALYQRLLQTDDAERVGGKRIAHATEDGQLVGRQAERRSLFSAWRTAAEGAATFVLLSGEAGIGKTRLAEELYRWAGQLGIRVARSRSYAASATLAYAPVLEWLRSESLSSRLLTLDPIWLSELSRLLPDITLTFPELSTPPPLSEDWQRLRLFEALARAVSVDGLPTLLWIDDLQWCDSESLDWLQYLMQFDRQAPLLILGTVRDEQLAPRHPLAELAYHLRRFDQLVEINLERFTPEEAAQLGRQIAGAELAAQVVEQLDYDAAGNPLFIVEMVRAGLKIHDGDAPAAAGATTAGNPSAGNEPIAISSRAVLPLGLPPKVYSVIQSRLAQLSPSASALAALAATIGKSFTYDVLIHAGESNEDQLVQSLDELWQRRIVRERSTDLSDYAYDFSHDRIRDVAYDQLSSIRRRHLHRSVAAALETVYAERIEEWSAEIAYHHEQAGNRDAALRHYRMAGKRSASQFAHHEALTYFTRSLDAAKEEDVEDRFDLHGLREHVHHVRAARDAQEAELATMMSLADQLDDDGKRSTVHLKRSAWSEGQGAYDAAVDSARRAIRCAQSAGDRLLEAEGLIRLGSAYWNWGDYARSAQQYRKGLDIARPIGEQRLEMTALLHLGALNVYSAPYADARTICHQALDAALGAGDIEGEIWARNQIGFLAVEQGDDDYGDAEIHLTTGRDLARKIGNRAYMAKLSSNLSRFYDRNGKADKALACLEDALAIAEETGSARHRAFALNFKANVLMNQGRLNDAADLFEQSLAFFQQIGYRQGEGKCQSELALVKNWRSEHVDALHCAEQALAIAEEIGILRDQAYAVTRKGYALEGLARWPEAVEAYERAIEIYANTGQRNRSLEPMAGLARIANATQDPQQAVSRLEPILIRSQMDRLDVVCETLWIYQTAWQILQSVGDPRAADIRAVAHDRFADRLVGSAILQPFSANETPVSTFWNACETPAPLE